MCNIVSSAPGFHVGCWVRDINRKSRALLSMAHCVLQSDHSIPGLQGSLVTSCHPSANFFSSVMWDGLELILNQLVLTSCMLGLKV